MALYFSIWLFCCIYLKITKETNTVKKLTFCFLPIFLMAALRYDWGGDYFNYEDMYNFFHDYSFQQLLAKEDRIEKGFRVLIYLSTSYRILIVLVALMLFTSIGYYFYNVIPKYGYLLSLSLLFFDRQGFMGSICSLRTSCAIAIFLIALVFLYKRKPVYYVALILFAFLFHKAVLFLLPISLIYFQKRKISMFKYLCFFLIYIFICVSLYATIGERLNTYIQGSQQFSDYEYYFGNSNTSGYSLSIFVPFWLFMLYSTLYVLVNGKLSDTEKLTLKLALIWYLFIFFPSVALNDRFKFYLDYLLIASVPIIIKKGKTLSKPYAVFTIAYFIINFWYFTRSDYFSKVWLDYHWCF